MIRARLQSQLLSGPAARDPVAVAERLLAIQGQDPRGARLAIRARSEGLTAADVDRALAEDRSLLITWLNRGTLHLVRSEDYAWLFELTTPPLRVACARRLAQEGVAPSGTARAVAVIERSLADAGPLTRRELRERIDRAGVRTEGQALVHLLMAATLERVCIRGPMVGSDHAYALVRDWLGPAPRFDRDAALAELARRFLAGHGPADDRDLAKWAGITLTDARAALSAIATTLVEVPGTGLVDLPGRDEPPELPPPRLLGSYDPLLHGWVSREDVLADNQGIVTVNGLFRPFALADGRAVGIWSLRAGKVELQPFGRLARAVRTALDNDAADVTRFLGVPAASR